MTGQTIAHYRVQEKIGAGGMGEVYRASDTRLNRQVALKFLPDAFIADADRMARFEREAQVLASLNHPRIATIHGLEVDGGIRALVMELVEGPTLAERMAAGPLPLEEALHIARQIAEALEYAHERGVVHRDLKPANIKVAADGSVKILDFGLAKALDDSPAAADISHSPTMSLAATKAGLILGTAAYMSPEQAKGKPADRRADIWAFGVVLYEMLTGRQLYDGETASEVLAAVIMKDPDWTSVPATTPLRIRELLNRCLRKDPRVRLRDIGEARIAIDEYLANPGADSQAMAAHVDASVPQPVWKRALPWGVAGLLAIVAVLTAWKPWQPLPAPPEPMRINMEIGADASLRTAIGSSIALSPDGSRLVFMAADKSGVQQLYVRALSELRSMPLSDSQDARQPFFSPDGQWIGFFAGGKLKKISVHGGAAITLCDCGGPDSRGGSWGENDAIIFASASGPLLTVPSAGGAPQPLTTLDKGELTHRWPQVLPGGGAVLFTASTTRGNFDQAQIAVYSGSRSPTKCWFPPATMPAISRAAILFTCMSKLCLPRRLICNAWKSPGKPCRFSNG